MNRQLIPNRRAGFSLAEVLVATAIFALVIVAAFQLYDMSQKQYVLGEAAISQQQNTRIGFEQLMQELRLTGFDVNRNQIDTRIDEKVEYIGPTAIVIRGNFDYRLDDAIGDDAIQTDRGREIPYEESGLEPQFVRVVTTGNDEVVAFALRPMTGTGSDTITFEMDTSIPRDNVDSVSRETVSLPGVDLAGTNPPYELIRATVDTASGATTFDTPVVLADNIYSVDFQYFTDFDRTAPIPAAAVSTIGGSADLTDVNVTINGSTYTLPPNQLRDLVRSVHVEIVGVTPTDDLQFVDADDPYAATKRRRKYTMSADAYIRNMLIDGEVDQDTASPAPPSNLTACIGHCQGLVLNWDSSPSDDVIGYQICYSTLITPRENTAACFYVENVTSAFIDGLTQGESYYASARALDGQEPPNFSGWEDMLIPGVVTDDDGGTDHTRPSPVATAATAVAFDPDGSGVAWAVEVGWETVQTNDAATTLACDADTGQTPLRDLAGVKILRRLWPDPNDPTAPSCDPTDAPPGTFGEFAWDDFNWEIVAEAWETTGTNSFIDKTVPACTRPFYRVVPVDLCDYMAKDGAGQAALSPAMAVADAPLTEPKTGIVPEAPVDIRAIYPMSTPSSGISPIFDPAVVGIMWEFLWDQVLVDTTSQPHPYQHYRIQYVPIDTSGNPVTAAVWTEEICGKPLQGTGACGIDTNCYRHIVKKLAADLGYPTDWEKIAYRIAAFEPCSPTIPAPGSENWSDWAFFPQVCDATDAPKEWRVYGNSAISGVHTQYSPTGPTYPIIGTTVTLEIDATTYLLDATPSPVLGILPRALKTVTGSSIPLVPDLSNPTSCVFTPAPTIPCTYRFVGNLINATPSPPTYNGGYVVNAGPGCQDLVLIGGVYVAQITNCTLKTLHNAPYDYVSPPPLGGIAAPVAVAYSANAYDDLRVFLARSDDMNGANLEVVIDRLAFQWVDNFAYDPPVLQSVKFGPYDSYTGQKIFDGGITDHPVLWSGALAIPTETASPNYIYLDITSGAHLLTDRLYGFELTCAGGVGGTTTGKDKRLASHPGLNISFRAQPFDASSVPLGQKLWCEGDPGGIDSVATGIWDTYWGECNVTNAACPNDFPRKY